jgi:hypothetical protein
MRKPYVLHIIVPARRKIENLYIINLLFDEFLGIRTVVDFTHDGNEKYWVKSFDAIGSIRTLELPSIFLSTPEENWLKKESMPCEPLKTWSVRETFISPTLLEKEIPIIFGGNPQHDNILYLNEQTIHLNLDIFGSCFFMLTRYEEVVLSEFDVWDSHDRFKADCSVAYRNNFLCRPIVNEYLEILWSCIKVLVPNIKRKARKSSINITHDVDNPFELKPPSFKLGAQRIVREILLERSSNQIPLLMKNVFCSSFHLPFEDRFNNFEWIMDKSEEINEVSSFYFISGHSASDPRYDFFDDDVQTIVRKILKRGHKIGIHPSYETYLNPNKLVSELTVLSEALQKHGSCVVTSGRQHYLRWKSPDTWNHWDNAGLSYDSSVYFAEEVGFRCGTCYDFSVFDVVNKKALKIIEQPLMFMESTIIDKVYLNLDPTAALSLMLKLIDICRLFEGDINVLWHNNLLVYPWQRKIYTSFISALKE